MEESWADAFADSRVGTTDGFFVELDDMMVPECSFRGKFSWLMRQNQGLLLEVFLKSKFEKVKHERNQNNYVVVCSTVNYSAITVAYLCVVIVLFAGSIGSHNLLG
eukprot:8433152-Ditylum_brightwellii.AAC.1